MVFILTFIILMSPNECIPIYIYNKLPQPMPYYHSMIILVNKYSCYLKKILKKLIGAVIYFIKIG